MNSINQNKETHGLSRRRFMANASLAAAAFCLTPRRLFAADVSPVIIIREAAATAKISITKLRGNVSVLEGSGGNIAVLTGGEKKIGLFGGKRSHRLFRA